VAAQAPRLVAPFGAAALLHAGVVLAILALSAQQTVPMPPIYRVDIVGAPPAQKPAEGVVPSTPTPPVPDTKPTPPPPAHQTPPKANVVPVPKARPRPAPPKATPTPPTTKAAPATSQTPAASRAGGPGTDVANVHTAGVDFPYPGYLENIVRQVALNFSPEDAANLRAEVTFLIKRDGTVIGFRFINRSNNYAFDLEAQGAIEKASSAFGPLPQGFPDDVLPIVFSFDPRLIH
jgi:periplasmic protein TonB